MKKNMGTADRIIRTLIALALFYWALTPTGPMLAAGVVGLVLLFTAVSGWCPGYLPFGISTRKNQ